MLKWVVFAVLWILGLLAGDALAGTGLGGSGSRLVFFGGMWMLACIGVKDVVAGYQERRRELRERNAAARLPAAREFP